MRQRTQQGVFVFALISGVAASTPTVMGASDARRVSSDGLWEMVEQLPQAPASKEPWVRPEAFLGVVLKRESLLNALAEAPPEAVAPLRESDAIITLPMPNGTFARFRIVESPVMAPALAAKFPQIKTYLGQGIDDPGASVRLDWTPQGFHAQILSPSGAVYIDPYWKGDTASYATYYKRDYGKPPVFRCLTPPPAAPAGIAAAGAPPSGDELRTYRLACAATGEYTQFHGGTVAAGMAAIVTAVNRVTGIYELEVAVRMELVPNNDWIVYTDGATDPYSNSSGGTMLGQNQSTLDAVIGNGNYDIGHVFSTGGGGVAYLGVVCNTNWKARGVTGLSSPVGDPFYVDYVAHEMGHQFGGNHSFNGRNGSCGGGNRHGPTAYEPGSGATIMAYAGICGVDNLQPNSDPYFHSINFDEMRNHVTGGIGSVCPVVTATGNDAPVVDAGPNYWIPQSTPFVLEPTSASDPNGDPLTYCWEEWDLGPAAALSAPDDGQIPLFRSFLPTASPSRTFPRLEDIINNTSSHAEKLPTTDRPMDFRVTVRDNRANGGGVSFDEMRVTVDADSGPFRVTSPNTPGAMEGEQTILWDVAGTDGPPVNASHVDILLSTDGGNTFPNVLAGNTPNDGSESVTLPDIPSYSSRIKVQAVGNIFFDMSDADFVIGTCEPSQPPEPPSPLIAVNRFLSVLPANAGRETALRVRFTDLPSPFDVFEGEMLWAGQPRQICENGGNGPGVPMVDCGPAPGLAQNWLWAAPLLCDPADAYFMDWNTLSEHCVDGSNNGGICADAGDCPGGTCGSDRTVSLYHPYIVPSTLAEGGGSIESQAQYEVQAVDSTCSPQAEQAYSSPLPVVQGAWGDVVNDCTGCPCGAPDHFVNVITDVLGVVNRFQNADCAPRKVRVDLEPSVPDFQINISDAVQALGAFTGESYPFAPTGDPCP